MPDHPADPESHEHFKVDLPSLLKHVLTGDRKFSPEEDRAMKDPQHPDVFLVCCIDSRFQPDKALDYGPGTVLEYRPIAAVIPPAAEADQALLSRMAFRRLKDVANIVIIAHSDCGGAAAAVQMPDPDPKSGDDLALVAAEAHRTGLDVPRLVPEFMKAAGGDAKAAGNLMAKEISVQSLKNIMGYKGRDGFATIADEVAAGKGSVTLLFYNLESHQVEKYDQAQGAWAPLTGYAPKPQEKDITPPEGAIKPPAPPAGP